MDLVNISIPNAALTALLGYLVVFLGLVLLMIVVMLQGKLMAPKKKAEQPAPAAEVKAAPAPEKEKAPGAAGELKRRLARQAAQRAAVPFHQGNQGGQ